MYLNLNIITQPHLVSLFVRPRCVHHTAHLPCAYQHGRNLVQMARAGHEGVYFVYFVQEFLPWVSVCSSVHPKSQ